MVLRSALVVLVGHVAQAVTHHVNDTQLNLSVGVFGVDRFREALQAIDTGNQDVRDPASLELGQDRQTESGLRLTTPHCVYNRYSEHCQHNSGEYS